MNYFLINVNVFINAEIIINGTVGMIDNYDKNFLKHEVKKSFAKKYNTKKVAVYIMNKPKIVSREKYETESKTFLVSSCNKNNITFFQTNL